MTQHLHPQRETYPLVTTNDELVMVFRDHLPSNMAPVLYIKSLTANAQWRVDSSRTLSDAAGLVVVDFSAGGSETISITVNGGAATVLTEGSEFDAVISNDATAINIADAINTAALGVTATFQGSNVFVTADAGTNEFTLDSSEPAAWEKDSLASVGTLNVMTLKGSTQELVLPSGTSDPTKSVSFLKVLNGRVSVDLRSPVEVRTYFRQPLALSGNTGHPGGWPVSPNPPLP